MKLSPSERLLVHEAIKRTERLWAEQDNDWRMRFITTVTTVEALVNFLAENHGRRHTWEWLQRMSDELLKKDLPP